MKEYEVEQAWLGFVECPVACHGFGVCSSCHDTGRVYNPLAARMVLLEAGLLDPNEGAAAHLGTMKRHASVSGKHRRAGVDPVKRLGPGIYAQDGTLVIDVEELLEANGWPATPENIEELTSAWRQYAASRDITFEVKETSGPGRPTNGKA